jgi:hypothetical protein
MTLAEDDDMVEALSSDEAGAMGLSLCMQKISSGFDAAQESFKLAG